MGNYKNPNWYCIEEEFRAVREHDRFKVGCSVCGAEDTTLDRRWPSDDYVNYLIDRICVCD